jgi:protoporphyrinogen oxidase
MPRRVAIVGAGVTGLVAGRELMRRGYAVTLDERWPDVAGQASAFEVAPGVWLERYYHHLFPSDREMVALHDELLPGSIEWHPSSVGIWSRGRIYPFVTPKDLLTYAPLSPADRLRLGFVVLRLVGRTDWERMDDIGALEWLRRTCGDRAVDSVWLPLLLGKFGEDAERIPLAWLWSKFVLRRGKGAQAGRERLGYPRGSFRAICVAVADDLRRRGATIELDREVIDIRSEGDEFVLHCAGPAAYRRAIGRSTVEPGREIRADLVLLTTPTNGTASLMEWPAEYRARLEVWTYRAAVVLLLELRRPYSDVYWMNVADMEVPFLGMVEHTNLVPADRYPARLSLRLELRCARRSAHEAGSRGAPPALPRGHEADEPVIRRRGRPALLGLPRGRRPTDPPRRQPPSPAAVRHAPARDLRREHYADLPRGPRHQLQRAPGSRSRDLHRGPPGLASAVARSVRL